MRAVLDPLIERVSISLVHLFTCRHLRWTGTRVHSCSQVPYWRKISNFALIMRSHATDRRVAACGHVVVTGPCSYIRLRIPYTHARSQVPLANLITTAVFLFDTALFIVAIPFTRFVIETPLSSACSAQYALRKCNKGMPGCTVFSHSNNTTPYFRTQSVSLHVCVHFSL